MATKKTSKAERLDELYAWAKSRYEWIEQQKKFGLVQIELQSEHRCLGVIIKMAEGRDDG